MDNLPLNNIPMLVSCINCLLRDNEFDNLDEICNYYNISRDEIDSKLASSSYRYNEELNSVKLI